jgi:uncharacterized membrane protein
MIVMRLVALFVYAAMGALIGLVVSFPHFVSLDPNVCIHTGAAVGLAVGQSAWMRAARK